MTKGTAASDFKRWKAVCVNGTNNSAELGSLETQFLEDMSAKLDKYGTDAYVSDKQAAWLDRIETKLQEQLGAEYVD